MLAACLLGCGVFALTALAQTLPPQAQWKDPSSVRLEVDFPGNGYHASWQLFRCDCGDLLIRSELNIPGDVVHGEILLVDNRAVLMRGYDEEQAEQISVDAPALMMQLALRLLERAAPNGPAAISQRESVAVADAINYINLDTGSAVGGFPPPWSVKGEIWPVADSQRRFDLKFQFNTGGAAGTAAQQGDMRLAGTAEFAAARFPVASDDSLEGWTLSWRDEQDALAGRKAAGGSLGEFRQLLKKTKP